MKLQTQDKYLDAYFPRLVDYIEASKTEEAKGMLRVLMKEVERDTLYNACDEINRLHNAVHNISI